MSGFAIRNPYFIVVICLMIAVVGVTSLVRMPVDMFPAMNIPVVVVATFYAEMPPEQIETDITSRFERFFTLGSDIEHIESRSLPGVSIIKVYFQPGQFTMNLKLPSGTRIGITEQEVAKLKDDDARI
jgi:multidrug efflux pump subunit AcrB